MNKTLPRHSIFPQGLLMILALFFSCQIGFAQSFYQTYPDYDNLRAPNLDITADGYLISGASFDFQNPNFDWSLINTNDQGEITSENAAFFSAIGTKSGSLLLNDGTFLIFGIIEDSPPVRSQYEHRAADGTLLDEFSIPFPTGANLFSSPKVAQLSDGSLYIINTYSEEDLTGPPDQKHFIYAQYDLVNDDFIFQTDILWSTSTIIVSIQSIQETNDGKLLVYVYDEANSNRHYLIKQEIDGTEIWRVTASSLERPVTELVVTPSGGAWFHIKAFNNTAYINSDNSEIVNFDINQFRNIIQSDAFVKGFIPRSDDGVLILGTANPSSSPIPQVFTLQVSKEGVLEQYHLFDLPMPLPQDFGKGYQLADGYAVTGYFGSGTPFLLRLDADGDLESAPEFTDLELSLTGTDPNPDIYSFHSITVDVENNGNIAATNVSVDIPQANGSVYQGGNVFTATQGNFNWFGDKVWTIGTLEPGESASITVNYFKTSDGAFGQYAEVATADGQDVDSTPGNGNGSDSQEDDEGIYGAAAIDFVMLFVNVPNRGVAAGNPLNTSYTFATYFSGTPIPTPVKTGFYLSTDDIFDSGDVLIGEDELTASGNNTTSSNSLALNIPSNFTPGIYTLITVVDHTNEYVESNESNNVANFSDLRTIIVTGPTNGLPDLLAGPIQFGSSAPYSPGDNITGGSYTLFNTGTQANPAIQLGYYLSTDKNLSNDDIFIKQTTFNATSVLSTTPQFVSAGVFVPNGTPSGQYYVLVNVDDTELITESDEVNNVRASTNPITVSDGTNPCDPDNTNPVFTNCPQDFELTTTGTTAIANWTAPTATDACPGTVMVTSNANPGDALPIGNNVITYVAEDMAGNAAFCTFTVRVTQTTTGTCNNNILNDPGFENGFSPAWLNIDGGGEETSDAYAGAKAMRLSSTGQARIIQPVGAAIAGETYTLSAFAKKSSNAGVAYIYIKYMTSSYQPIVTTVTDINGQSYEAVQVSLTAPPNTAFMEVGFEKASGNFTATADEWCLTTEGSPLGCTITGQATNVQCDNNGTPNNPGDDTFTFNLLVNSSGNCGSEWEAGTETGQYGTNKGFGPYLIANGPVTVNINDKDNPGSSTVVNVTPPAPCSNGSGNLPDLVLSNVNSSASAVIGSVTNYTFDLINQGTGNAVGNFNIKAYFSTDNVLSNDDIFDGLVSTGNLGAGQTAANVPGASTVPTSLTPGDYFLILKVDADEMIVESVENNNTFVRNITLTGGGNPNPNCAATSDFPWEDWISRVKIGTVLDQVSSKTPYSDYTGNPFPLVIGESNSIELRTSFSYFTYDEYWRVWIDWNGDNSFGADEIVFQEVMTRPTNGTANKSITGNFSLPANASTGSAKMRVIMTRDAYADPCGTVDFGEVEDYQVNILNTSANNRHANTTNPLASEVSIYPNPVKEVFTVELSKKLDTVEEVLIFDQFGKQVYAQNLEAFSKTNSQIEIRLIDFVNGSYFLQLRGEKMKPIVKRIMVQSDY